MVESSKQDSQSTSQNPFQPLSEEDSEGESDTDSFQLEINHNTVPSDVVVDEPIDKFSDNPSDLDKVREVKEKEVPPFELTT